MFSRSKAWALSLLAATFVAGLLMGGGVQHVLNAGSGDDGNRSRRRGYVEYLTDELDLAPAQREAVSAIVEASRSEMKALSEQIRPQYDSIRSAVRARIRDELTAAQNGKFDEMIRRAEERRRKHEHQ